MELTSIYDVGDLVWVKSTNNLKYQVGKIIGVNSWDEEEGFIFSVNCHNSMHNSIVLRKIAEDDLCKYDEKEVLINQIFVDDSEMLTKVNEEETENI